MKNIRQYENLHIALWLLKDTCWVMSWRAAGMVMIIPTLLVALHITWLSRKNMHDLLHNIAVSFWISANCIWMTGEFFYQDGTRPYAMIFFTCGIAVIAYYYLPLFPKKWKEEIPVAINENAPQ